MTELWELIKEQAAVSWAIFCKIWPVIAIVIGACIIWVVIDWRRNR